MLNIFNTHASAFEIMRLTTALTNPVFVSGRLGQMGLFDVESVDVLTISLENIGDSIVLVPPTPRGGPGVTTKDPKRNLRALTIPHFQIDDAIKADEVQGVRAFGTTSQLETVLQKVVAKLARHARSLNATEEACRLGAIKGVIAYAEADGITPTPALNLFDAFDIAQPDQVNFDLRAFHNSTSKKGEFRKFCDSITRNMIETLGGLPFAGIRAMCGRDFMDWLLLIPEVREVYLAQEARAQNLLESMAYKAVRIGDITFEEYRGSAALGLGIGADDVHLFPEGVPGLFKTYYGPADYEETVNTLGEARYAKQWPMDNGKGRHLESQTNMLHICTRPQVLVSGYGSTAEPAPEPEPAPEGGV